MDENTVVNTPVEQDAQGDAALGAAQNVATDSTETGVNTGAAAPQEKSTAERFAYALKQRVLEETAKLEKSQAQKYEGDLKLAQEVRKAFVGKDDAAIVGDLLAAQVKVFAAENNISETLAREFIDLKRSAKQMDVSPKKAEPLPATDPLSDTWLIRLSRQRAAIQEAHGMDVLEDLSPEEESRVMKGEIDLNEVFAMRSKAAMPPPVNRGTSNQPAPKDFTRMSDEEYEESRKLLQREGRIDYRSD